MCSIWRVIAKVRPAFQQNDRVAAKAILGSQVRTNRGRHTVAELIERSLNSGTFQFGNGIFIRSVSFIGEGWPWITMAVSRPSSMC